MPLLVRIEVAAFIRVHVFPQEWDLYAAPDSCSVRKLRNISIFRVFTREPALGVCKLLSLAGSRRGKEQQLG